MLLLSSSIENFKKYDSKTYLLSRNKLGPKPRLFTREPTVISYIPLVLSDTSNATLIISYNSSERKNSLSIS